MSMKTMMKLASGLGLLLAVGCKGSVDTDPSGGGGSGGGTTSSSATTGSGGACAGFEDTKASTTVTVRFINKDTQPIYLPGRCSSVDYAINPTSGKEGVTYNYDEACLQTCADLQTSPPFACGACAPRSYLLAPGATREFTWDGTGLKYGLTMPTACWAQHYDGATCSQIVAAPAANYAIDAIGFSSCGAGCTCDDKGICNGAGEGDKANADPVKFDFPFPAQNLVEVVFNNCAFGCPED